GAIVLGLPGFAVEVKVTGDPVSPFTSAVAVCAPAVVPNVCVAVAIPAPFVNDDSGGLEPPPPVTAHVTATPDTGLLPASVTLTAYGVPSVAPMVSVWALPENNAIVVAVPPTAVAVKVTGEPVNPATVAVAVCDPVAPPSTRVAAAMPPPLVIELGVIDPPPVTTAHVTVTPGTALPSRCVTSTV